MKNTEIDRQFDEAFERLQMKTPPLTGAYNSTAPLAADHFLLKKSWDYFRSRVRTIEDQWRKMLDAKDAQLRTAMAELVEERKSRVELEDQNHMLRSFDVGIKKARTEDMAGFARKAENLRMRWDAEREVLQRKIDQLELRVVQQKKDIESKAALHSTREAQFREMLAGLKTDAATQAEREHDIHRRNSEEIKLKDEKIQSLDTKVELLRGEIERRDMAVKELERRVIGGEKDHVAMVAYVAELQQLLKEREAEIRHQQTRLGMLTQEKDALRAGWERERAEWRELWDRGREMWDKRR